MKLSQRLVSKSHRVLLFGSPKAGKTLLAGKLAERMNVIIFDMENGVDSLLQLPKEWQERVEVINLPDTRSFPIAIETCLKAIKGGPTEICETHGKVGCSICKKSGDSFTTVHLNALGLNDVVIFDSLTQLTNSAIAHITKGQPEDYKLQHDDWGNLGKLIDTFLSHVQQAQFNVVCITHETEVELEDGKNKLVPTAGTRNFSRNTAKYFDEVYYCEVKNKKHSVGSSTLFNGNILTGSRTGIVLENQSIASLLPIFPWSGTDIETSKRETKTESTGSGEVSSSARETIVTTESNDSEPTNRTIGIKEGILTSTLQSSGPSATTIQSNITNKDTPAHKSLSALDKLRLQMKANNAAKT